MPDDNAPRRALPPEPRDLRGARRLDPMVRNALQRRRRQARQAEEETSEPEVAATSEGDEPPRASTLWESLIRPSRAQLALALVLGLVALGVTMQIRARSVDDAYSTARRADLVQMLDGLNQETRRMEEELAALEKTRSELQSGADSQEVARDQARQRIEELSVMAGTVPAQGPGVRITIRDPKNKMTSDLLLDAIEELRDAGAESIEVNDTVRIVGSSWFAAGTDGLVVDGKQVTFPLTIEAIGDAHALEEAARFRGGLVSEVTGPKVEGQVEIVQSDAIVIDSVHDEKARQYAKPAPTQTTR